MKKSSLLLFLVLFLYSAVSFGQWTKLNSGTALELYSINFTDSLTGYCVGGNPTSMQAGHGIVLKTTDGGANWLQIYEDTNVVLQEVVTLGTTVSVVGTTNIGQKFLLESTDSGHTWNSNITSYSASHAKYIGPDLYFINAHQQTLEKATTGSSLVLHNNVVLFTNNAAGNIFALCNTSAPGYDFVFAKSTNGGMNWDTSLVNFNTITSNSLSGASLWAFGDTIVFLATYPSAIAVSYNKGQTWKDSTTSFPTWGGHMTMANVAFGTLMNTTSKTTDVGKTIYKKDTLTDKVKCFSFPDKKTGYLCGENGMIYKTTAGDAGTASINILQTNHNVVIYPNPFNYSATFTSDVTLNNAAFSIYNNVGILVKQYHVTGKSVQINRDNLPAGIYFYKLTMNGELISQGKIAMQD